MSHSKRYSTIFSISKKLTDSVISGCIKLAMFSVCVWSVWSGVTHTNCIHASATATPRVLPTSFMTESTLSTLRNKLCKSCGSRSKKNICNDVSNGDLCHLLCGCNRKCLGADSCTCPLKLDAGCRQGVTVCEFDDAVICSTSNDVCLYYDETKIHCDCLEGWTGANCQTCDQQLSDCGGKVEDTAGDGSSSGSDLTVKALVAACGVCLLVGVLLGVICVCRPGKLVVCITHNVGGKKGEEGKNTSEGSNQTNVASAKQNTENDYCHIGGQYAVPGTRPTPSGNTVATVRYAEPTPQRNQAERTDDPNYYFSLEPTAGIVTYESVALVDEAKDKSRSAISADSSPEKTKLIYSSGQQYMSMPTGDRTQSSSSPKALSKTTAIRDDDYDHLERKMGVTSDTDTGVYSHLKMTTNN